jgi:hypothetical protein
MNSWTRIENTDLAGAGAAMVLAGDEILLWGGDRDRMSAGDGGPMNTGASIAVADLPLAMSHDFSEDRDLAPATEADAPPVLWPTGRQGGPWRKDPTATAEAFGRLVLGWEDARVTDGEPSEDGRFGERLTLSSRHIGSAATVLVVPEGPERGYAVAYVGADRDVHGDEPGLRVSIRGRARVVFAPGSSAFEGAISATARIEYGTGFGSTAHMPTAPPWEFDIPLPFSRKEPGSLLILVRGADGEVIGATGTGLPPGDYPPR